MQFLLVILSAFISIVASKTFTIKSAVDIERNNVYGYLNTTGLELANKIRKVESMCLSTRKARKDGALHAESSMASLLDSAGLIADLRAGQSVCGGSLLNARRVLTAAHCWTDGIQQALRFTVVLGSVRLYSGGTRMQTSKVDVHSRWNPQFIVNDIAMIHLPHDVQLSSTISPVALPSNADVNEDFAGHTAVASGFGLTGDGCSITASSCLGHVQLKIITNSRCQRAFEFIQPSNICTMGNNGENICSGDSGGPLAVLKNNWRILIGVTSFGSKRSCQDGLPAGFTRVSSFIDWINTHL